MTLLVQQVWPTMADVKAHLAPGSAAVKLVECAKQHQGQLQILALGTQGINPMQQQCRVVCYL